MSRSLSLVMFLKLAIEHLAMPAQTAFVVAVELHACCALYLLYMKLGVDAP